MFEMNHTQLNCSDHILMVWMSDIFGCVFLTWRKRFPFPMNALPHWLQPNGFSPVCKSSFIYFNTKIIQWGKCRKFSEILKWLTWLRRCETKWPFEMKSLGHKSQRNGRSAFTPLLWLRWWKSRFPLRGNAFPHVSQAY